MAKRIFYCEYPNKLNLQEPGLRLKLLDKHTLHITGDALAKSVFLSVPGTKGKVFSDNYFDMPPGERETVNILLTDENIKLSDIKVISLYDSYN